MAVLDRLHTTPRGRLSERVTAASYGTIMVLAALALIDADAVTSGLGWELVTGVGVATWLAHLYAEVVGDLIRHSHRLDRTDVTTAMVDGLPILLATVLPAIVLVLGRLEVFDDRTAVWLSVAVALLQLIGVGAYVGLVIGPRRASVWRYAAATAVIGLLVVALKLALGH